MKTISLPEKYFLWANNIHLEAIYFRIDQRYLISGYPDVEKFKLERKRERNRIAATKCR
jgi:hypothetical protein